MIIPGFLIAWLTFPGVIVHESAHLLFCKLRRIPVFEVAFFRFAATGPAGYVIHEKPPDFTSSFLISVGPFLVNTVLCIVFCFPAFIPVRFFGNESLLNYFWLWLGLSIGMHAFPSVGDAQVLWSHARELSRQWHIGAILSLPVVGLIYLANVGSFFWLDLLYGVFIGLGLPELVLRRIA